MSVRLILTEAAAAVSDLHPSALICVVFVRICWEPASSIQMDRGGWWTACAQLWQHRVRDGAVKLLWGMGGCDEENENTSFALLLNILHFELYIFPLVESYQLERQISDRWNHSNYYFLYVLVKQTFHWIEYTWNIYVSSTIKTLIITVCSSTGVWK